ncbi:tetratricopeptide repeat protein [Fulvivirga sedimenti]|uniref:Tetratricopeptide repeat protein n=1 Tax=Fulvivirga sedimenti TaxID=2879465 RepID=A0A9X1HKL6_9BACT|nr:tetratricopeptide repeat protein [Fulvivirga sedimenti]MCA6073611.1 tetratricopeptide repeat protein [Fulvivirga sedimenti]
MKFYFLLVLLTVASISSNGQQLDALLTAERILSDGDTVRASTIFQEILRKYPDSYAAALRLTEVNYQRRLYSEAIQYSNITEDILLRKIDSLDEKSTLTSTELEREKRYAADMSSLHHFKGKIRLRQHRAYDALEEFDKALVSSSDSAAIMLDMGLAYIELNQPERAKAVFNQVIRQDNNNAGAYFNIANLYYNNQQYDSAKYYYQKTASVDPEFVWAYLFMGEINTRIKQYDEAVKNYTDYLNFQPSESVYFKRAVLYAELREWESSLNDWDSVLSINPKNPEAYRNRGLSNFQVQDYRSAINDFNNALLLDEDPYTFINRGYSYYLINEPRKAMEDFDTGLASLPEYSLGFYLRALTWQQLRKRKRACEDLQKAIDLGMDEGEIDKEFLGYCD